ncbi:N-acetylglutamate kinase [Idiomarina fontislapidosi]|uniref:Acetylglutamate kinase n=1 Tax=Idiomarina fontislapidosi TaxID=263723 RepID=A0A432XRM7_9GAMM|nr:acetylglutamate kinase [Idiomarina fontislapidosi]PYE30988.1 N-acetylglutamate kinase [Idiomarina fontislapidosi]RUO51313.1 acetylglutamate kinase [Idiomarina fontislapidosi]
MNVIKLGGRVLDDPQGLAALFQQITQQQNFQPTLIVHGGGQQVDDLFAKLNLSVVKYQGLRVSVAEQMPLIVGALAGTVNKQLLTIAIKQGLQPVGLTLYETGLHVQQGKPELGLTGHCVAPFEVSTLLLTLLEQRYLPIVSCVGFDADGQWLNVNADEAAAGLAKALSATLTFVSDVPAVLDEHQQPIDELDSDTLQQLIDAGTLNGGMRVKVEHALTVARFLQKQVRICGCSCDTRHHSGTLINP